METGTSNRNYPPVTPSTYKANILAGTEFNFVSAHTMFPYNVATDAYTPSAAYDEYKQEVYIGDDTTPLFTNTYKIRRVQNSITYTGEDIGYTTNLLANTIYRVVYTYDSDSTATSANDFTNTVQYTFTTVENRLPLKKWTVAMVIDRLCDLVIPIRKGETPRYRLNAAQHAQFDKVLAPEFSFTKSTMRECLKEVGGFIHGEPRITPVNDGGIWYYEISYDMYASQERSGLYTLPYIKKQVSQVINDYATSLDSSAENLINQLKGYTGVIKDPYANGSRSLRTETLYTRITDINMMIETLYPIYSVSKVEYVYNSGGQTYSADITPFIFEETEYSSLSSYSTAYPYSKAYAVYYTQGVRNIYGLNFKLEAAFAPSFQNYAIVNILQQALNNPNFSVQEYPELCFRVTYTPIYNARIGQGKSVINSADYPAALVYNQGANLISSHAYGENMKGAIARLGNIDKTYTFILSRLSHIPKAGQMYDDDYYISTVAWEIYRTFIKCTVGLSKDFNRLSEYIGINSVKRFYEVSERQAVERNLLYREYIKVGFEEDSSDTDCCIGTRLLEGVANTFIQSNAYVNAPVSRVVAWGSSKAGAATNAVSLPVVASAFGNSISFSWKYEDNYSAATTTEHATAGEITGYWQVGYPYGDYYGRIYYYSFDLQQTGPNGTDYGLPEATVPSSSSGIVSTYIDSEDKPYILRKDNREVIQGNFQVDFVTTEPTLIIGSALPAYNTLVRGIAFDSGARLYVLPTELNKFTDHIEAWEDVDLSALPYVELTAQNVDMSNLMTDGTINLHDLTFPASGASWVIVTPQTTSSAQVENEDGEIETVTETIGGDLLIGQNISVISGHTMPTLNFAAHRKVLNDNVWVNKI